MNDYLITHSDLNQEGKDGQTALSCAMLYEASLTKRQWQTLINQFFHKDNLNEKKANYLFSSLIAQENFPQNMAVLWKLVDKDLFIAYAQDQKSEISNKILSVNFIDLYIQRKSLDNYLIVREEKIKSTFKV